YAASATIQILLFSVVAIELKRRAPYPNFPTIYKSSGTAAHIIFTAYSFVCQISEYLQPAHRCFLLPIGVVIQTLAGGEDATVITDWAHTVIIYIFMLMSTSIVYTTSSVIGTPGRMWTLLKEAAVRHPVGDNARGEHLTMASGGGAYLGLVLVGAGFAGVVHSQLFEKPSRKTHEARRKAICWAETRNGLPMPRTALAPMGTSVVFAVVLACFMAVTSAMSLETVATAALLSYNVYKAFFKPDVTEYELKRFSEYATVGLASFAAAVACGPKHAGFAVDFIVTATDIWIDSAIIPMVCTTMCGKQSKAAVIFSPLVGSAAGMIACMLKAYTQYGKVNITTLQGILPLDTGNMMALTCLIVLTPLMTFIKPDNYDWNYLQLKSRPQEESQYRPAAHSLIETSDSRANVTLFRSRSISIVAGASLALALLVLWPIPIGGLSLGIFAAGITTLLPIWEGRHTIDKQETSPPIRLILVNKPNRCLEQRRGSNSGYVSSAAILLASKGFV
ncbi:hypothetical protein AC579_7007, partial [Pseudocercospora musae]